MARAPDRVLNRWVKAGLLTAENAERIRAWEAEQQKRRGSSWVVALILSFGALLLSAGVLLFVAANWDELSPAARFALVTSMVVVFHGGAALANSRLPVLGVALHAAGTTSLGAAIFLVAQIFNLHEHWPTGFLLWAIGAASGWILLRDWPHALLFALLAPAWVVSERLSSLVLAWEHDVPLAQGLFLLAFVYLTARERGGSNYFRRSLSLAGGIAVVPATIFLLASLGHRGSEFGPVGTLATFTTQSSVVHTIFALLIVLAVGLALSPQRRALYLPLALWVSCIRAFDPGKKYSSLGLSFYCLLGGALVAMGGMRERDRRLERTGLLAMGVASIGLLLWANEYRSWAIYPVCIALSLAEVFAGVRLSKRDAVNLGVLSFAGTVIFFYLSRVMDKLGRSASLIGVGLLFVIGGILLERTRRRLLSTVTEAPR